MPEHGGEAARGVAPEDRQQPQQIQETADRGPVTDSRHGLTKRRPDRGSGRNANALC